MKTMSPTDIRALEGAGLFHRRGFLDAALVAVVLDHVRDICRAAPLRQPSTPSGQGLHLKVTSAGRWGWWSDARGGYRYVDRHPTTGAPWPAIPAELGMIFENALDTVGVPRFVPDSLLINHYADGGSLGLHVDRTEEDLEAPIVSLSIGADAVFQIGGLDRFDPVRSLVLSSGDLLVQSGRSRSLFHGIAKLLPTMSSTLPPGQRINLTFRKVKR